VSRVSLPRGTPASLPRGPARPEPIQARPPKKDVAERSPAGEQVGRGRAKVAPGAKADPKQSAVALRSQRGSEAGAEITPKTHPEWFTRDGAKKWKKTPRGVLLVRNRDPKSQWIEKWKYRRGKSWSATWVYNYREDFVVRRAGEKFAQNRRVAETLPRLRKQLRRDLAGDGRQSVVALMVALIDQAYFRVGNEESSQERGTYGVTTLEKRHLRLDGQEAVFDYVGKAGVENHREVCDTQIAKLLKKLLAQCKSPSERLFRFRGEPIEASEVNSYLEPFGMTAKNFRTYHATRLAREYLLARVETPADRREDVIAKMFGEVAEKLGHTEAVCRSNYVDPVVTQLFEKGRLKRA
jgi:integrase